ncbi:wiskott-Aldrich syndrome protein family member 1-like [Mycetomoellerius zeteki]|uniref:wiskott-Aldrich syndrome protein family member 1-like n=1 Tax=Mycetomoellerius zeteki TaxID=64791 RepID=UPI00084E3DB1|nr:PREDICTED: wiskott-Aldrich syndrome protein family member 1-like [Trachymyrmex zeteki]
MERDDILKALDDFIGEEYDPANPAMDPDWCTAHAGQPWPPPQPPPDNGLNATPARKNPPVIGCVIQASDRQRREKLAWLTATPPPPPPTRRAVGPPRVAQPRSETATARAVGPLPPPPIPVEVEPGHVVNVPHFSAHVSRQYKTRSGGTKWHIRFNGNGTVRSVKRK